MSIAKTTSINILLIASIAVSILMSAIIVTKIVSGQSVSMYSMNADRNLNAAPFAEPANEGAATRESIPSGGSGSYAGGDGTLAPGTDRQLGSSFAYSPQSNLSSSMYSPVYESAQYILPISWGAVAGTLIWRGKVRSSWCKQGYDYETFRLVARTRGSPIRVKLLNSIATAKNRLQLANELAVDWKTVDNHMEILKRSGLAEEKAIVGTTRYYVLTEHGRRILLLLADGQATTIPRQQAADGAPIALNAAG